MTRRWLSVGAVGRSLGISPWTVYRLIISGTIPPELVCRPSREYRIKIDAVYLLRKKMDHRNIVVQFEQTGTPLAKK